MRRASWLLVFALAGCGGETLAFWPTGVRRYQGAGSPGAEEGEWRYWYFDGQLRARGAYQGGVRVGLWETFFRNGQRAALGTRAPAEGRRGAWRTATWTFWHENGTRRATGAYDRGLRQGPWTFWNADGGPDAARSGTYVDGVRAGD